MDSSQFRLQGSPIKTFFPMIKNHPLQDNHWPDQSRRERLLAAFEDEWSIHFCLTARTSGHRLYEDHCRHHM
jgi:hypothetical protein